MLPNISEKLEQVSGGLQFFEDRLVVFEEENLLRERKAFCSEDGLTLVDKNNKSLINFSGNNYLGLSLHPQMIEAAQKALEKYGASSTSSQLINGFTPLQEQLEKTVCQWLSAPSAIVYNSGYQANVGLLSALIDRSADVFMDKLCHASLYDGLAQAGVKTKRYPHNSYTQLKKQLERSVSSLKFIITESLFSMDGDLADLEQLLSIAKDYNAFLIIDEAHALGVYGKQKGAGCLESVIHKWPDYLIVMGTFSKALGGFGAFVAGTEAITKYLVNKSRALIYTTALPPAVLAGNLKSIELLLENRSEQNQLWQNINYLAAKLNQPLDSPILPWVIGAESETLALSESLYQNGLYVQAIRPPTVPEGTSRLRITLSALHTQAHINQLLENLKLS